MKRAYAVATCLILAIVAVPPASAQTNLGKRTTIDVTEAPPTEGFRIVSPYVGLHDYGRSGSEKNTCSTGSGHTCN